MSRRAGWAVTSDGVDLAPRVSFPRAKGVGREAVPQVMDSNVLEEETVEAFVALFDFVEFRSIREVGLTWDRL